jgi:hypothetical protein
VRKYLDLLERVVWTFVQAFAASLLVTGLDDLGTAAKVALGAGIISTAKCLAAMHVGDRGSAAALPGG